MDIKITINCDNAAFVEAEAETEISRILEKLSKLLESTHANNVPEKIMDINGNCVGKFEVFE